ncbi:MAG: GDP-mannose 4,6-dehydratase [bacterium]
MKVLVFGATGFAGQHLAGALQAAGHEMHGAARKPPPVTASGEIPVSACDVRDAAGVAALIAKVAPDAIINLAGLASSPAAHRDPAQAFEIHTLGAVHILEAVAAGDASPRVVIITSSELYGTVDEAALPLTEEMALRPTTIYAASKAAADLATRSFAMAKDVDVVCLRPFNHTGPGQRPVFVCPDFASQVAEIARGEREPRIEVGNIDVVRDFSDVRDITRGYVAALDHGSAGGIYNLCSGRGVSIRSMLDDLCEIAGVTPEIHTAQERWRPAEVPRYWGSAAAAERDLGWVPRIPWRQTLEDLYASFARSSA